VQIRRRTPTEEPPLMIPLRSALAALRIAGYEREKGGREGGKGEKWG